MIGSVAALMTFGAIFALMLRGRAHPWSPRRARTRVRRTSGPNFTTMVAVAALTTLLLEAAKLPIIAAHPTLIPVIVGIIMFLIVGYIVVPDFTKLLVGGLGIALVIAIEGLSATMSLVVLAALLLWLLGALRGWLG